MLIILLTTVTSPSRETHASSYLAKRAVDMYKSSNREAVRQFSRAQTLSYAGTPQALALQRMRK